MKLEELRIYNLALEIGEQVWKIVNDWEEFPTRTVGYQLVRSADSIAANIAEGHGRFHYRDRRNFLFIARGSLSETKCWIRKSFERELIKSEDYNSMRGNLDKLGIMINNLIESMGSKIKGNMVKENPPKYGLEYLE